MDQDLIVLTPEKTLVSYRLAGLGSRISAHLLDLILVIALVVAITLGLQFALNPADPGLAMAIILPLGGAMPFLYFILFEGLWNGQTIGKRSNGIRVRMSDGTPITFSAAMGRNLIRPADMLPGPYLLGLLAIFTNPRSQRIGDLVANTVVCYDKRPATKATASPHMYGIHPMESEVGSLPGMTLDEYQALKRLCDRYPELSQTTQAKLLAEVWLPIAERRKVPNVSGVHPLYLAEAVVMKYGRNQGLL